MRFFSPNDAGGSIGDELDWSGLDDRSNFKNIEPLVP